MSGLVEIKSTSEWQSLLSGTDVVIADCECQNPPDVMRANSSVYADWCGPCKMIAPQFQRLAAQHSSPKKVAFAKVNVDSQQEVAQSNGVSAMPTFLIFHKGSCIETIKGANPSALSSAITKAVQLAGSKTSDNVFKTPGRTLGGQGLTPGRGRSFDTTGWLSVLTSFFGLYLVTLFSVRCEKVILGRS